MADPIWVLHDDHEPDFSDLTGTFLERENDRIVSPAASSASEGLDRLADAEFDCRVSDHDMPGQNRIGFLETVRTDHPDLPLVPFAGKGTEEIASDVISAGVTDYLQKERGTNQYTVLTDRITNAVERYRSKQALEASETCLSLFIEQSPLGVIAWNTDFELVIDNQEPVTVELRNYRKDSTESWDWVTIAPVEDETGTVMNYVGFQKDTTDRKERKQ